MSRASNQRPLMLVRREPQKVHDPKCPNCRYVVHIAQQPEKPHGEMAGKAKRSSCGKCNVHNNFGFGSVCTVQYIYRIIPLATASMRFRNKALYTDRVKPFMALPISIPRSQRSAPALHQSQASFDRTCDGCSCHSLAKSVALYRSSVSTRPCLCGFS